VRFPPLRHIECVRQVAWYYLAIRCRARPLSNHWRNRALARNDPGLCDRYENDGVEGSMADLRCPNSQSRCADLLLLCFQPTASAANFRLTHGRPVGSVLIWIAHPFRLAPNVLRIHSETDSFLAFASPSNALNSDGVTRIRRVSPLASPLGNDGRPTLLGLG